MGKQRDLLFKAKVEVPGPYTLYWKVRNGGEEANRVNHLRGEITQDGGQNRRRESTAYKGSHYVECYAVKDGVVVATDRHDVIVT